MRNSHNNIGKTESACTHHLGVRVYACIFYIVCFVGRIDRPDTSTIQNNTCDIKGNFLGYTCTVCGKSSDRSQSHYDELKHLASISYRGWCDRRRRCCSVLVLFCTGTSWIGKLHKYVMDRAAAADVFTVHRTDGIRFIRRINRCSMHTSSTQRCLHLYSSGGDVTTTSSVGAAIYVS